MFDSSFKMCDKTTWYRVPLDNWYIRPSLRRCNSSSGAIWWHDSRLHHLGLFMLFKQCIVTLAPSNTSFSRICPCTILNFFYYHQQHQHTYTHTVLRAPTIKKKTFNRVETMDRQILRCPCAYTAVLQSVYYRLQSWLQTTQAGMRSSVADSLADLHSSQSLVSHHS